MEYTNDIEIKALNHFQNDFGEEKGLKFFNSMVKHLKEKLFSIDESIINEDREDLIRHFHSLKGLLLQGGLNELSQTAKELEARSAESVTFEEVKLEKEIKLRELIKYLRNK